MGRSLDEATRSEMEGFFGADLGDVRIHADSRAAALARSLDAEALTIGHDVYFGEGNFDPATRKGKALLGHELTHVLQQKGRARRPTFPSSLTSGNGDSERDDARAGLKRLLYAEDRRMGDPLSVEHYRCEYTTNRAPLDGERLRLQAIAEMALDVCEQILKTRKQDLPQAKTLLDKIVFDVDLSLATAGDRDAAQAWGRRLADAILAASRAKGSRPSVSAPGANAAEAEARSAEEAVMAGTAEVGGVAVTTSGSAQRKPSGGPARTKYTPPTAATHVAKKFPNLKVPADQLTLFQRLLDARAAMKEIDEDPVWASILSEDDAKKQALRAEASEWAKDDRVAALVIPTETVLANDILLKEDKDARTQRERRFREQLYATMLTFPVRLVIAPKALEPDLTLKWGPNDWDLPSDGGKVTFQNLMGIQKFSVAYQKALLGDQVELLEGMAELARFGTTYNMTGKKVGETWGYVWNTTYKVGYEVGRLTGYYDDPRGRQELEKAKNPGARIVLKNPADGFLHVYQLDPALNSNDLRAYDKDLFGKSTSGMVYLYAKGSEVGAVDEIMTADGFLLSPGGDSYGTGWGTSDLLTDYEKFAIGAVMGDAFENQDAVMTVGQIVIGCIPIVGQVADARDVAVGIHKIWTSGGKEGKLQTVLSLIGFVPLIGDGIKSAWKAGRKGIKGPMTKELAKDLAAKAVKEGAGSTAEPAAKELGERILRNADEVAEAFKVSKADVKATVKNLEELAAKAVAGDVKAAKEFGEQMGKQLDALGGNAGSLVGMMGGDWAKLAKMLTTSPEGALVGQAMEKWRAAQFTGLDKKVASKVGDVGAQAGVDATPNMARTGTPSFASDVDISFLGPMSTQHRNAAIHIMEQQFGPGWRQLLDADIFADPARLHLFEDPLKKLGGKAAKDAGARIIKESELNVFAKMLKDGVPYEEVKRLATAAGVDMAEVAARQKEIAKLSVDRLAAELRKGTPREEVAKMAKEAHVNMADVEKHLAGGEQLYKQLELKLDALHAQFAMAQKAGDVARQAQLAEEMAALQGKLNAAIPGPYMTPGGGAKHVSRREKALRPGGGFQAMSPILGYTAVIDDLYMLMHALPEQEFTEKSAKGMAKYGDRLLVTAGQFGVEMKGSTRSLFDQISGLLERARLEKDKPALEKAIGFLDQAKGTLNSQLTDLISGAKRNASEYLKNTADAAPTAGQFADKTQKVLMQQASRVSRILIRKEIIERDRAQSP